MYCAATGATIKISTRKRGAGETRLPVFEFGRDFPLLSHSVGVGANDFTAGSAAQGAVRI